VSASDFRPETAADRWPLPRVIGGLALVGLATWVVYYRALSGAFVYDDLLLVQQNPALQSWSQLGSSLVRPYWDFLDPGNQRQTGYWRPLSSFFLRLGHMLDGGKPDGFHQISLFLHLCASGAAFWLARAMTKRDGVALAAALLFALHPLQVESVAWISALNDPLAGALSLCSLSLLIAWRERGSRGLALGAAACLFLALCAKEVAMAVLPLALVVDWGRCSASSKRRERLRPFWRLWGPLLASAAGYVALRAWVFASPWGGLERVATDFALSTPRMLSLRVEVLGGFLHLLAWPHPLNLFREVRPQLPPGDLALPLGACWITLWAAVAACLWWRDRRPLLAAWTWIGVALAPVLLRLGSVGRFPLSDRFAYMAVFGAALSCAALGARHFPRWLALAGLLALGGTCAWRTQQRLGAWRDEESLFRASVSASPRSVYALWGLGRVLTEKSRRSNDAAALNEAHQLFLEAQDLISPPDGSQPDPSVMWTPEDALQANLGVGNFYLLCTLGGSDDCTLEDAALVFSETVKRFPQSELARNGLGVVRMLQQRLDDADAEFARAIALAPQYALTWYHRGQLELRRKRWDAAASHFQRAAELQPADAEFWAWHATALLAAASPATQAAAEASLALALQLDPGNPQALLQSGMLACLRGDLRAGERTLVQALTAQPTLAQGHALLGKLYLSRGEFQRGVESLQRACQLDPADLETHALLGTALGDNGYQVQARPFLERALELGPDPVLEQELRKRLGSTPAPPR
jgi:Flp pilus assembly protein TadD